MLPSEKQIVWIVLEHPMQLTTALSLASYWGREKFIFNLLIAPHHYWGKVDINVYKHYFDKIFHGENFYYTGHPLRILKTILRIWRLKKKIARIGIGTGDIIIGLSIFSYLENIVLSVHKRNWKAAIIPSAVYQECIREMDKHTYRHTLAGLMTNWLVEPITGLHRTYCMKDRLHPNLYWRLRYRESLADIYDKVIIMGGPPDAKKKPNDIISMPYPYVLAIDKNRLDNIDNNSNARKVVFFGSFFKRGLLELKPEVYARYLNKCLSFLRDKYGDTKQLIYRPHPAETDEATLLDLSQFEIEDDGKLAELYFLENIGAIYAVFSVGSTSSRSALHFFINSYVFLDIFPIEEKDKSLFKFDMGNVPGDFYISDLDHSPKRYIDLKDVDTATNRCQDVLDRLLPI